MTSPLWEMYRLTLRATAAAAKLGARAARTVERLAYRAPGVGNLHPADAALNLPVERHSHGLRKLWALESPRGSFDGAIDAIERHTGVRLAKRQVQEMAGLAAMDFEDLYETRRPPRSTPGDLLVLSADGKGIVMRADALRTRAPARPRAGPAPKPRARVSAAAHESARSSRRVPRRSGRGSRRSPPSASAGAPRPGRRARRARRHQAARDLSGVEQQNRRRMAEIGAVYDAKPAPRTPADILALADARGARARSGAGGQEQVADRQRRERPAEVIKRIFDEAQRRDPKHRRT
jgi:hypothetical protein